jgi:ATP-dependent DNA ligase
VKGVAHLAILYEQMESADTEAMFRHACGLGLEGIVSKRARSRYKSGRCLSWVKVKNPAYERRLCGHQVLWFDDGQGRRDWVQHGRTPA